MFRFNTDSGREACKTLKWDLKLFKELGKLHLKLRYKDVLN